jgi:hypothetical protein
MMDFYIDNFEHSPFNLPGHKHTQCEGVVHKLKFTVNLYILKDDFYIIDIGRVDVLGIQWLISIGI